MMSARLAGALLMSANALLAQTPGSSWLDQPFTNWNAPSRSVPRAKPANETIAELTKRCESLVRRDTAGERALADAGWLPFHVFDRPIIQRDVEILGGMTSADGMCRPTDYNVFVFVGGSLAGTLSPVPMTSRVDGAAGAVRLAEDETIAAQFQRYTEKDPLCCPSGRVTVRYRIDRKDRAAVVVPIDAQSARP